MPNNNTPNPSQTRASTGISGLDNVLNGGLPSGHLYLFEGEPGTGKTTLGLHFLLAGLEIGEKGLYVTLSETAKELKTVARSHGWDLDQPGITVFELVGENELGPDAEQSIIHPAELELSETVQGVMKQVENMRPQRVVFDSLSEMRLLAQDPLRYRRQVLALKHFFAQHGCTVLMLDDLSARTGDMQLRSIAHGVVWLHQVVGQYGADKRYLRVAKIRGIKFRSGEHDFKLDTGGIQVFPRLVAAEHHNHFKAENVSTGNHALDVALGGGLARGSNTLFIGPSGVGKTTTALACVHAAIQRGEKAAYYLFDEGLGTLLPRAQALGYSLSEEIERGNLLINALDPAEVTAGEFAARVRQAVERDGVQAVVIDSLNAYLQAMPGSKFLLLQMHELLTYLNQRGIMTILVLGQHGVLGEGRQDIDLSYLSDAVVMFRYFEGRGNLLKALSVTKSRTNQHATSIHEFRLGAGGVEVGEALTDFEGVIAGVSRYTGNLALLGDSTDDT
ncbi:ATPase domain-containing protein [Hydrogenophaga laconesensis]|uniref:non-specific serine/threonine protein kinase n=1 Tax=Hydrogenophaga laconesensis TaxID=1805971 RepID=A0ABU1V4L3_9BURK|nr:ATPase domain-containing protein [Hydrogenophaga laconesensis]MDR7092385.1 circadian clock protein KaiC [Hydrogenophaga laconesensis]